MYRQETAEFIPGWQWPGLLQPEQHTGELNLTPLRGSGVRVLPAKTL